MRSDRQGGGRKEAGEERQAGKRAGRSHQAGWLVALKDDRRRQDIGLATATPTERRQTETLLSPRHPHEHAPCPLACHNAPNHTASDKPCPSTAKYLQLPPPPQCVSAHLVDGAPQALQERVFSQARRLGPHLPPTPTRKARTKTQMQRETETHMPQRWGGGAHVHTHQQAHTRQERSRKAARQW